MNTPINFIFLQGKIMQKQKTQTQTQWKNIFIVSVVLLGLGYLTSVILTREEPTPSISVISSEVTSSHSSGSNTSLLVDITGTGKANDGKELPPCNLVNPFQSGTTECESEEKPKFQKPNTEWKTRTISGVTYVFGEGNPKEVALSDEQLKVLMKKCGTESDPNNAGYLCKDYDGYMTPEVEMYLKDALSDPNWNRLLAECEENLRWNEWSHSKVSAIYDSHNPTVTYPIVAYTEFLDVNKWITVNTDGRKELDQGRLNAFLSWFSFGFHGHWIQYEWPSHLDGSKWLFKDPTCVDRYGANIMRNLVLAQVTYLKTGREENL
jgi:hypothetical protein